MKMLCALVLSSLVASANACDGCGGVAVQAFSGGCHVQQQAVQVQTFAMPVQVQTFAVPVQQFAVQQHCFAPSAVNVQVQAQAHRMGRSRIFGGSRTVVRVRSR